MPSADGGDRSLLPARPAASWHGSPGPAGTSTLPSAVHAKRLTCQISAVVWQETCSVWSGRLVRSGAASPASQRADLCVVLPLGAGLPWGQGGACRPELLRREPVVPLVNLSALAAQRAPPVRRQRGIVL